MSTEIFNKKCGIINVSMKNNFKKVYSFNCCFCDTIFMQMKKFTMHLEHVHESHLGKCSESLEGLDSVEIEVEESCFKSAEEDEPFVYPTRCEKAKTTINHHDPLEMNDNEENLGKDNNQLNFQFLKDETNGFDLNLEKDTTQNCLPTIDSKSYSKKQDLYDKENVNDKTDNINSSEDACTLLVSEDSEDERSSNTLDNEVIVTLLRLFKEYPDLWSTPYTTKYNLNENPQLLQTIVSKLNDNLKLKLSDETVKSNLISLCKQYEKYVLMDLQSSCGDKEQGYNEKRWFFEHMEFMRSAIVYRSKEKKSNLKKLKPLKNELISDLIEIYKNYRSLWDVKDMAFPIKEKRKETLYTMVTEINNKMQIALNISKLSKHLNYIHSLYAKDKRQRLECENNEELFKPSFSLYDKCRFLDANLGPFRCSTCKEIIEKEIDFRLHQASHDGSMPFICPDCGMGFKKKSYYSTHVKRHLGYFKFHCEICGKGYPFNAELEEHMRSHTGAQPFLCSICGEGFGRASTYDNHIRRHEERFKYFCEICRKGFNCMTRLKDHVKGHLNVRDCICSVCGKSFTSRRYLSQHKRIHATKSFICNLCGKGFGNEIALRSHKKYHENGKNLHGSNCNFIK